MKHSHPFQDYLGDLIVILRAADARIDLTVFTVMQLFAFAEQARKNLFTHMNKFSCLSKKGLKGNSDAIGGENEVNKQVSGRHVKGLNNNHTQHLFDEVSP